MLVICFQLKPVALTRFFFQAMTRVEETTDITINKIAGMVVVTEVELDIMMVGIMMRELLELRGVTNLEATGEEVEEVANTVTEEESIIKTEEDITKVVVVIIGLGGVEVDGNTEIPMDTKMERAVETMVEVMKEKLPETATERPAGMAMVAETRLTLMES